MILLERLPEPDILRTKKGQWLAKFLEKCKETPGHRPDSRQYGHEDDRDTLREMSFHKCFYCERKLSESEDEVDHYIEVAERSDLAFEWSNLYLSCRECNGKLPNKTILVSDCLDPCDDENPDDHLTFEGGQIRAKPDSQKGRKTIQKYKLDRDNLNFRRERQLRHFFESLDKIRQQQIQEGRNSFTDKEKEVLALFKQPDYPYSLMFKVNLAKYGL